MRWSEDRKSAIRKKTCGANSRDSYISSSTREINVMTKQYIKLMTLLIQEAVIANFEYWGEFIIRLQRDNAKRHPALRDWFGEGRIPPLFGLRLRGKWWIGEKEKWTLSVQQFPMKGVPPIPIEAPLQASTLMMMLDSEIFEVRVDEDSNLMLVLSNGQTIAIQGVNEEWEESWFLELPVDDPDRDQWSIVCDSQGHIYGRFPGPVAI